MLLLTLNKHSTIIFKNLNTNLKRVFDHTVYNRTFNTNHLIFKNNKNTYLSNFKNNNYEQQTRFYRLFGNMASQQSKNGSNKLTRKEMNYREILKKLFNFVWPKDNNKIKARVAIALALLIGSKILNVCVPFFFKEIIDFLNKNAKIKDFNDSNIDKALLQFSETL